MSLIPVHNYCKIRLNEPETSTSSGIFMGSTPDETQNTGTVVAVGEGVFEYGVRRPVVVRPGDEVLFGKFAGTKIQDHGETFMIVKDSDIIAVEVPEREPSPIDDLPF